MICPYCQTNIKDNANIVVCHACKTPHHRECWDENKGCTLFGCEQNPNTSKKGLDVGDKTIDRVKNILNGEKVKETPCPNCNELIPENSLFCNFCGYDIKNKVNAKEEFEKEFKKRYKERVSFSKKRIIITSLSIALIIISIVASLFVAINKLNNYLRSDEYQIKSFLEDWRESWQKKDINKYKSLLDKDYLYIDKDGKSYNLNERIKRINYTFENYKFIKIHISDVKITKDSATTGYINVSFIQSYVSDVVEESGKKTLRLYKGNDTGEKWKIFREYFE